MLAAEGFQVEANATRPRGHGEQYTQITVPSVAPESLVTVDKTRPPLQIVPGDFVKTYEVGGPGFRRFDALVTCFFIDTPKDVEQLFRVMDGLLEEGGVWVNLGPLNWRKEARAEWLGIRFQLKLAWEEIDLASEWRRGVPNGMLIGFLGMIGYFGRSGLS
eukprot:Skav232822  [mRNA]  locus=scaffold614:678394:681230:- [translate_table: standard]